MSHSIAEAVTDLEVRVAYQDRALATLDEVVRSLYKKVEFLEQELAELRSNAETALPIGPANEPPPHY